MYIECYSTIILSPILPLPPSFSQLMHLPTTLVLASSRLASLELIKVPSTDSQITPVGVHAVAEVSDIGLASSGRLVLG